MANRYTRIFDAGGKTIQKGKFCIFFHILWARDQSQRLLQALASNFPSKMRDLDAYVSSYDTFRRFWKDDPGILL